MKIIQPFLCAALLLAGLAWHPFAAAQGSAARPMPAANQYSEKGADTCLECHDDEAAAYSASAVFKSKHGMRGDKRAPFGQAGLQCEACHGPGALHARNKKIDSINGFRANGKASLEQRNQACMSCHAGSSRTGWHAGAHERSNVACTDCHKVHKTHGDPALSKVSETEVCLACHKAQRADFHKPSSHPVRQGQMSCSGCHSPHGSTTVAMLKKPTLNQTCYDCHADKRGPLLWEHQPVSENCASCHTPHGSVRPALLSKSPPMLCQQCHSQANHPSLARSANGLPGGSAGGAAFLIAGSCSNCHSQVHGSNHPAGAKLMR